MWCVSSYTCDSNVCHLDRSEFSFSRPLELCCNTLQVRGGFKNPSHGYTARLQLLTDSSPASSTPIVTSLCIPQTISIHTYASKIPPTTIFVCRTPHCTMSFDYISVFHFSILHPRPASAITKCRNGNFKVLTISLYTYILDWRSRCFRLLSFAGAPNESTRSCVLILRAGSGFEKAFAAQALSLPALSPGPASTHTWSEGSVSFEQFSS